MGICWYCYWGWAESVANIYKEALKKLSDYDSPLHFGPSHIVWEDENFETSSINFCLEKFNDYRSYYTNEELEIVKWSLEELLKIPENERCIEPIDYDDENPALFPLKIKTIKL